MNPPQQKKEQTSERTEGKDMSFSNLGIPAVFLSADAAGFNRTSLWL